MLSIYDQIRVMVADLIAARSSWIAHWREIGDYTAPRRGRFLGDTQRNDGRKRNDKILNSSHLDDFATLSAGLADGLTPRRRRWFRLTVSDPDLARVGSVQRWLYALEERMWEVFARSNIYDALGQAYYDAPRWGVFAHIVEEDAESVLRSTVLPPGSYAIATDARGRVDTLYREYQMSVAQLVERFGFDACSEPVRQAAHDKRWLTYFPVSHLVAPHRFGAHAEIDTPHPWVSLYFQTGFPEQRFLRVSGYRRQPFACVRWSVTGDDVYAHSPAMDALGDIKQLQRMEADKLRYVEYMIDPPMGLPAHVKATADMFEPRARLAYDTSRGADRAHPLKQMTGDLNALLSAIDTTEQRIRTLTKANAFKVLTYVDRQMTAYEAEKRIQEALVQVGTTIERFLTELLDPLIERTYDIMDHWGLIPPLPAELDGVPLRVEYISTLGLYYRRQETIDTQTWLAVIRDLAALDESATDVIDIETTARGLAERYSVPPNYTRTREEVAALAADRRRRADIAEGAAAGKAFADAAAQLAPIEPDKDSLLRRVLERGAVPGAEALTP